MEVLSLKVLPVEELGQEYGIADLGARLSAAGYTIIPNDGRQFVVAHDWHSYVRGLINAAPTKKAPDSAGGWNELNRAFLERYPDVKAILDGFLAYLTSKAPEIGRIQNRNSVTLDLPNHSQAGAYLKRAGVWLYATRNHQVHEHIVTEASNTAYAQGLGFLRALPAYH
jgi:hypothetical protein